MHMGRLLWMVMAWSNYWAGVALGWQPSCETGELAPQVLADGGPADSQRLAIDEWLGRGARA
jgi:hypothetical protein